MAEVKGYDPAPSGQDPIDGSGTPVPRSGSGATPAQVSAYSAPAGIRRPTSTSGTGQVSTARERTGPFQGEGDQSIPGVFGISSDTGVVGIGSSPTDACGLSCLVMVSARSWQPGGQGRAAVAAATRCAAVL
jgi:hypothetical protein